LKSKFSLLEKITSAPLPVPISGVEEATVTAERPTKTAAPTSSAAALRDAAEAEAAAAEAEAEAAEAEAQAAAARARAIRSRLSSAEPEGEDDPAPPDLVDLEQDPPTRRRRPRLRWLVPGVAVVLVLAFCGASGYLVQQHRATQRQQALTAEFNAAARQGVVNLMSVDFTDADANVKRLLDSSTGKFKDDLQGAVAPLTKTLADSKVTTTVTVDSTAVESLSADTGVVLVAASTEAQDPSNKDPRPAKWRVSVTLTRDGGQLKMSQVDFVS
jgi:Mce-associated membrane protein